MFSSKVAQLVLAIGVGIGTGTYVFKPLLEEYREETHGTWIRPGDEEKLKEIHEKKHKKEKIQ